MSDRRLVDALLRLPTSVVESLLHEWEAHPDWEYEMTTGPRKEWTGYDNPPEATDWDQDCGLTWVKNTDKGSRGWERFDYHEEAYWRRPRNAGSKPRVEFPAEGSLEDLRIKVEYLMEQAKAQKVATTSVLEKLGELRDGGLS